MRLWHGGIPGLSVGDIIEPGHKRRIHDGCPWCEARAQGEAGPLGIDGPSREVGIYATTSREYARHYASLWGRGDLYRVEPIGEAHRSTEDTIETYVMPAARVMAVYARAVLLTCSQRRALAREWAASDQLALEARP